MSRAKQRADRIRREISIVQVLVDYGYPVHSGYGGEEQFSCDLHGDGSDGSPSARVYPDTNSMYCFACDRSRDTIQLVREKEGVEFWDAVKLLEKRYKLGLLEYTDEGEQATTSAATAALAEVKTLTETQVKTFEDIQRQVFRLLDGLSVDRDFPLDDMLRCWEAYDKVSFLVDHDLLLGAKGMAALLKVQDRVFRRLQEAST